MILSIDQDEVLADVEDMDDNIDSDTAYLTGVTCMYVGVAVVGLLVVILVMGKALAKPLTWLKFVANQITDNAGNDLTKGVNIDEVPFFPHSPRTEITELVEEFKQMIRGFSGGGAAKAAKISDDEVLNKFPEMLSEFKAIYKASGGVGGVPR